MLCGHVSSSGHVQASAFDTTTTCPYDRHRMHSCGAKHSSSSSICRTRTSSSPSSSVSVFFRLCVLCASGDTFTVYTTYIIITLRTHENRTGFYVHYPTSLIFFPGISSRNYDNISWPTTTSLKSLQNANRARCVHTLSSRPDRQMTKGMTLLHIPTIFKGFRVGDF